MIPDVGTICNGALAVQAIASGDYGSALLFGAAAASDIGIGEGEGVDVAVDGSRLAVEGTDGVGAMRRLDYEGSPKHGTVARGDVSAAPVNGQDALDMSIQVKSTSPRRVGIDYQEREFVVFDETSPGVYHGHVRPWSGLTQEQRNALIRAGMTNQRGDILAGSR